MRDFNEWYDFLEWLDGQRKNDPRAWFKSMVFHDRHRTSYWVMRQLTHLGAELMARGQKKSVASKAAQNKQWTTFVEISLAGHSMADIEATFASPDDLFDGVQEMAVTGHRISVSFNESNDAVVVSVTCKDDDSVNAGCTFTAFARDWVTALKVAVYKHVVVAEGVWRSDGSEEERPLFG